MTMRHVRIAGMIFALTMCAAATFLWIEDGAWQNGAMPTKGVIRTFLFAGGAWVALLLAWLVERRTRIRFGRPGDEG